MIPEISIISAIYNGETTVDELVEQINAAVSPLTSNFEIILIEDCGPDKSWEKIEALCKKHPHVKGLKLSRNFGQQMAMSAAMRYAKGNITIIMDGDLQNPPDAIPQMVAKIKEGFDIVYTVSDTRNNMKDELTSKLFWFLMNKVFKVNMIPNQLMLKALSRRFMDEYNNYDERIRVVAGITHDIGLNGTHIKVENRKRTSGKSNYSFFKRFHLMLDIVLAMTNAPLNYMINISLFSLLVTFIAGIWNTINYLIYTDVPAGYTTLVLLILFFGSLTTLILGIIGRYLSNIYMEVRRRPTFIINKALNLPNE